MHRSTRDKREADRIKAVVLLATGWTAEAVAEVLQVDANTVRNHFKRLSKNLLIMKTQRTAILLGRLMITDLPEKQTTGCEINLCFARSWFPFIILTQSTPSTQPSECSLDHPAAR